MARTAKDEVADQGLPGSWTRVRGLGPTLLQINWRPYAMLLVVIAIWLVFNYLTAGLFISARNMTNLLRQASLEGILATGMVLIIVSGQIDLSAGSAVGLVAIIAAVAQVQHGWSTPATLAVALGAGLAMGIWQGFWIAYLRVPSFIVTLGGMLAFRGITLVITQGESLAPFQNDFVNIGQGYIDPKVSLVLVAVICLITVIALVRRIVTSGEQDRRLVIAMTLPLLVGALILAAYLGWVFGSYLGIPYPVTLFALAAAILAFMARKTRFGRHLYAIGGNREASRLAGIPIARDTFEIFVLMGLLYGVVGILLGARLDAAVPNGGFGMELDAIAMAVIGGTSLMGGIGSVGGAVLGAILILSIANGMSLLNISTFYQLIVSGLILMVAVYIDIATKKQRS
jgi:D-xylose transport system permease protein